MFFGFLPFAMICERMFPHSIPSEVAPMLYAFGWAILCLVAALSCCPRCDHLFHLGPIRSKFGGYFSNGLTRKCMNCGLPLNATKEEIEQGGVERP